MHNGRTGTSRWLAISLVLALGCAESAEPAAREAPAEGTTEGIASGYVEAPAGRRAELERAGLDGRRADDPAAQVEEEDPAPAGLDLLAEASGAGAARGPTDRFQGGAGGLGLVGTGTARGETAAAGPPQVHARPTPAQTAHSRPAVIAPVASRRTVATATPIALAAPVAAQVAAPLPTSGVLASTFVGGRGAQARLEDLLDRGVVVGGEHVRLEAFDELGRLPYPVPADDAVALHAGLERTRVVSEGGRVHLQIALLARQGELPARPRMDVRLVFDRSGSMHGDKWTNAIAAAHALVDRLGPNDTFGLVSYSDSATLDLAPRRLGDRRAAHAAIDALLIGGGTNIEGALALAAETAPSRRRPSDVPLVVLLSDGVASVGQTSPEMIATRAREMFDANGVITTSIGVGTEFDEATMLAIAREGSGSYHFVRRSEDVSAILTDELEQRVQAVAQDLRLRIELAPGVVATRVYGSRVLDEQQAAAVRATEIATDVRLARELGIARDRQQDDQRGLRMHFPTFRRGDQHVVMMELEVPPGVDRTAIAQVSLDWKDLSREANDHATVAVSAERTGDADASIASTDRHVKRTVLAFQAGEALQQTAQALERGDVAGARLALSERIELLRAASSLWRDAALARDLRILEQYERVVAAAWGGFDDPSRRTLVMAMNDYGDRRMR